MTNGTTQTYNHAIPVSKYASLKLPGLTVISTKLPVLTVFVGQSKPGVYGSFREFKGLSGRHIWNQ
jgi:hypothetical protein